MKEHFGKTQLLDHHHHHHHQQQTFFENSFISLVWSGWCLST
jgi:hypothetical protein